MSEAPPPFAVGDFVTWFYLLDRAKGLYEQLDGAVLRVTAARVLIRVYLPEGRTFERLVPPADLVHRESA